MTSKPFVRFHFADFGIVMGNITNLLGSVGGERSQSESELLAIVYEELRNIARSKVAVLGHGNTLQATALVHEAWMKLTAKPDRRWESRRHFYNTAALAMGQILHDAARRKSSQKGGGKFERVELGDVEVEIPCDCEEFLAVHEAIAAFESAHPFKAELVRLKYFFGFENQEVAEILGVPVRSIERHWTFSKAWLLAEMDRAQRL